MFQSLACKGSHCIFWAVKRSSVIKNYDSFSCEVKNSMHASGKLPSLEIFSRFQKVAVIQRKACLYGLGYKGHRTSPPPKSQRNSIIFIALKTHVLAWHLKLQLLSNAQTSDERCFLSSSRTNKAWNISNVLIHCILAMGFIES